MSDTLENDLPVGGIFGNFYVDPKAKDPTFYTITRIIRRARMDKSEIPMVHGKTSEGELYENDLGNV